jgi:hypothetical protein
MQPHEPIQHTQNLRRHPCTFNNCGRYFRNRAGLTKHLRTKHAHAPRQIRTPSPVQTVRIPSPVRTASPVRTPSPPLSLPPDNHSPIPEHFNDGETHRRHRQHKILHPLINGMPCDKNGNFLDPDTPPPHRNNLSPTNWSPFDSRISFETAEFLYKRAQMSAGKIDDLLDLWAASLLKAGGSPLFKGHRDLYHTIDSAKHGDVPWKNFKVQYDGGNRTAPWMSEDYDVWYRDPHEVVLDMLARTDFNGEVDAAPFREYGADGKRVYHDFMSGDWAWKQAVS